MKQITKAAKVRVRFPPSPTGFLHIGSLRTALYNYLFARKNGGDFVLRIEDTDRTRYVEGATENILRTLSWCGIEWDEGPYIQSERLEIYLAHAEKLLASGNAYYCTCTPARLEELRQIQMAAKKPTMYDGHCRDLSISHKSLASSTYVVRLKIPRTGKTAFADIIHGKLEFENKLIDDQVLLKSDGYPTYHLANVVDDHEMKISHVIRGEEWLPSTPKHVLLYKAFGWKNPEFAHLPLLLNSDHSKLSKRQGDVAVEDYVKKGYLKDALINFVALLGWNPRADKELYRLDELIANFELTKVNKSGAVVNFEKLDWMNGHYIRQMPLQQLTKLAIPYLKTEDQRLAAKVVALEQERLKKLSDLTGETEFFFAEQLHYEPQILVWKKSPKENVAPTLQAVYDFLKSYTQKWEAKLLEDTIKEWINRTGRGVGDTLWPMRVALSGRTASPPPFEIAAILGKEKTLSRIQYAITLAKKI